jgi:glutamate-1-semialdehyde 2,1-aminomutase
MRSYPDSASILDGNRRFIPGGVVSTNRAVEPEIAFARGEGAYIWSEEGHRFLDYHAAFAAHLLGHNDPHVTEAVIRVMRDGASLFGSGTTRMEGQLAERICSGIPWVESVQFVNTGSEATYQALRVARAATARDHLIVMQGGYNGWHNDVACNLMTPATQLGPRVKGGEYAFHAISAGIPDAHCQFIHPVNFNDLDSVEMVCRKYSIAGLITEPALQNIGIVPPLPGYLQGLRELADRYGFVLIFDEVKTGFRSAFGGLAERSGVQPDIAVYGKALANGYPIAAIGGRRALMDHFVHTDPTKRVLLAGTYNAHPVPVAAALATLDRLQEKDGAVYRHLERLGQRLEAGLRETIGLGESMTLSRIGGAFCLYFMDHVPIDWHDLLVHHDFEADTSFRRELVDKGIYFFPLAIKQCSISSAHTVADIDDTVEMMKSALAPQSAAAK